MSKKDSYQKQIDIFENELRFLRNIWLAVISGIIWSIYAIMEEKSDLKIIILSFLGILILGYLSKKINNIKQEVKILVKKLSKE